MTDSELEVFLAHSLELESEAAERYGEMAATFRQHHNVAVSEFFERMESEAEHHLAEVREMASVIDTPHIKPWDFQWPDAEAPESLSYEAMHYRMSLGEAVQLALANEHAAQAFYAGVAEGAQCPKTRDLAAQFAAEEAGHARHLEQFLATLPEQAVLHRLEDDQPHMPE